MLKLFDKTYSIPLHVACGEDESVLIAVQDLQKNLRRLAGRENAFDFADNIKPCISISTTKTGDKCEGYAVSVSAQGVKIEGHDSLGTIFGIYAFCENILKIDPMYRISGLFPAQSDDFFADDITFCDHPKGAKFRGWFINDEDLLTDFRAGGGKRNIDYPFYANVMHESVLEMILETALRLKINMIIPSSFVDIDNPDEEKLVAAVCRRGLYISQHHVEPLGVSYFAASAYIAKNNKGGDVSFVNNRAVMEEIWRYYAQKWAVYGDRVIWQLGLRGKADTPVWRSDKSIPLSNEERGKIIGNATQTQYQIVKNALNSDDFESTVTLWMEGAELYGMGHLAIPDKTIVIFSDVGFNQMFGDDFYKVARKPDCRYGVYYHIAIWNPGPHLAEGCAPAKMEFSYREAIAHNTLYYSILNVSNLRELHIGAWLNALLVWNPAEFNHQNALDEILRRAYGDAAEKMSEIYKEYYEAFAELDCEKLKRQCKYANFHYHEYGELPFKNYAVDDGNLRLHGLAALDMKFLSNNEVCEFRKSEKRFYQLLKKVRDVKIPAKSIEYYKIFPLLQTKHMLYLTRWLLDCTEVGKNIAEEHFEQAKTHAQSAASHLEKILEDRTVAAQGEWQGWYNGDKKMDINKMIATTLQAVDKKR